MKKIMKPILLLGSVIGLVGCSANGVIRTVDYASASGLINKAYSEIYDCEKMPLNKIHSELKSQFNVTIDGELSYSTNDDVIFDFDLSKDAFKIYEHYSGEYAGGMTFDDLYLEYYLYDETYGMVYASDDYRGHILSVDIDIASLFTEMFDCGFEGSIDEWGKTSVYSEVTYAIFDISGYDYLDMFSMPEVFFELSGYFADYSYSFKSDGKVVQGTCSYETVPSDNPSAYQYNSVQKQEFSFKLDGLLLTELKGTRTNSYTIIDDDYRADYVETRDFSYKSNKNAKVERPNLADYFLVSND